MGFKDKVEDYHMGSLLRLNCEDEINDKNTTLGRFLIQILQ